MLRFAARQADIIGINATLTSGAVDESTFASMTAEQTDSKVQIVRDEARAAGRLADIEMNIRTFMVFITEDIDKALDTLSGFTGAPKHVIAESPFALVGPPNKIIEELQQRRQRWGFSYVIVGQNDVEPFAPVVAALTGI